MKAYDKETGMWNEVYSECQPVDLREFGEKTCRVLDYSHEIS